MLLALLSLASAADLACPGDRSPVELWDEDGRTTACVGPQGLWEGPARHQRVDGSLEASGDHTAGERAGRWRFYTPEGALDRWGSYAAGLPTGDWFTLDSRGEIVATVRWVALDDDPRSAQRHDDARVSWVAPLGDAARQLDLLGDLALVEVDKGLLAIDVTTGQRRWSTPLDRPLRPGFVAQSGVLAAVTAGGELLVVDPESGLAHRIRTPMGVRDVLAVHDDVAIVREGGSRVEALALETGRSRWRTRRAYDHIAPTQVGNLAVLAREYSVQARALSDGTAAWSARLPQKPRVLATSYDGQAVFVLDAAGGLSRLQASTGELVWRVQAVGPVAAQAAPQVRADADAVVIKTGQQLVSVRLDGTLNPRVQLPKQAAFTGDRLGDQACFSTRTGLVDCGPTGASPEQRWTIQLKPLALPPLVLEERVLAATGAGTLLAIDPRLAQTAGGPLPEQSRLLHDAVEVVVFDESGAGEGIDATAPLIEREVAPEDPACRSWEGALDLHALTVAASGPPGLSVVAPAPAPTPALRQARPALPPRMQLDLPAFPLDESSLDAPGVIDTERWTILEEDHTAALTYWIEWRPQLLELGATGGDPEVAARVDRLLRCEAPAARFQGFARLQRGGVEQQVSGRLGVAPVPHRLDGAPGCLLQLDVSGEPLGTFAVPDLPGWVELSVTLPAVPGGRLSLPAPGQAGPPAGPLPGGVVVELLEPGAATRSSRSFVGPVSLERAPAVEPSPATNPEDILVVDEDGEVLSYVPADGLLYGQLGEGPKGRTVPVVQWQRTFSLEGSAVVDRSAQRFLPVWSATWCPTDLSAPTPDLTPD